MRKFAAIALVFALIVPEPARAVNHVQPGLYPRHFRDKIHHPSPKQIAHFGSYQAAISGGSTGSKNVAVIIVQFASASSSLTSPPGSFGAGSGTQNLIQHLSNIKTYYQGQAAFYNEVSYGKITLNFTFFGQGSSGSDVTAITPITLTNPMEYYGCGDEGEGCSGVNTPTFPIVNANGNYLIRDAIDAVRTGGGGGASLISRDNGGTYDAIAVMHAGNGNETTRANGDIWSIFYSQDDVIAGSNPVDAVAAAAGFTEGDVVPETEASQISSPLGVMCHEFGHTLGLPDLYNTGVNGGNSVVGFWELMDAGPFDGAGANPSHMGAWDKLFLGWATPVLVTAKSNTSIGYVEVPGPGNVPASVLKLPVENGLPQEYFLAEYRSRSATGALYDHSIPGDGLLIWHVDDAITSARGIGATDPTLQNTVNTGSPHDGVSIVTADGVTISNVNQGDAANAFANGSSFDGNKSNNFAGHPSGIIIANISGIGTPTLTMDTADLASAAVQSILKLINYPNPAGKKYPHPSGTGHTTLQFQLSQPAQTYSINIYTLSGDLVRQVGQSEITFNLLNRSQNQNFVYEYIWDLTNGDGRMVAPGVYFYLLRADGETQTGKAVIIR